jgi:hypothetical protein
MDAEMYQIKNCNTWDLKLKPNDIRPVKSKWVFTKKFDSKGNLKETVWMEQPEGYKSENPDEFCLLNKTLYGLKQSPREWNEDLYNHEQTHAFM